MQPDNELLRQYATAGSESAFAELVKRHVNLVYSAALRQTGGDTHLAHDVAQSVFTDLARKAASLLNRESLSGWLYTSAYFAANKMVRGEIRRRQHEERFMREPAHENPPEANWEKLRPLLDAAMHSLKESDRDAILLRYFESRPYAEVGAKFGLNENAARLRVERALEKLRALLAKRGLAAGTTLASILSANAIQTAPVSLSANFAHAATASAARGGLFQIITETKIKLALGTVVVAGIVAFLVLQHSQAATRRKNETLADPSPASRSQNVDLANQLLAATTPIAATDNQQNEASKLPAKIVQPMSSNSPEKSNAVPAAADTQNDTNTVAPDFVISLTAKVVTVPAVQMPALSSGWAPAGNGASLISAGQLEAIGKTLAADEDSRKIGTLDTIIGNHHPVQVSSTKSISIDSATADIGLILGATPSFSRDSSVFSLNLLAQLKQLADLPQPALQTLQISNQVNLFAGESTVLEQDIPSDAWLTQSLALPTGQNKLLVFVTPTILASNVGWNIPQPNAQLPDPANSQKMADAREAAKAIIQFASENRGQIPSGMMPLARYINDEDRERIRNDFQVVSIAPVASLGRIASPSATVLLQENREWQGPDGKWRRTYGFADGHAEIRLEGHSSFE